MIEVDALIPEVLEDRPMPFTAHLVELRERIIWSLGILGVGALAVFQYSGVLLSWLARPAGQLVFIAPAEAFHTRIRVGVYGGFLLTLPLLLHQVWLFVARALDRKWRMRLLTMVPIAYALFLSGVAVCLFLVMPAAMKFFLSYGSEGVRPLITLNAYLGFVTTLSLAFGAAFEFPLALYVLDWMGVLRREQLLPYRRLIYFASFIFPAFFTPDVFSQICLAVSISALFELSLLAMRLTRRA